MHFADQSDAKQSATKLICIRPAAVDIHGFVKVGSLNKYHALIKLLNRGKWSLNLMLDFTGNTCLIKQT